MADRSRSDTFKSNKNPLLTSAALSFPFENISANALLVPQPLTDTASLPSDGEVDSFLGQDAPTRPSPIGRPQNSALTNASISSYPQETYSQNQSSAFYNPLICSPICTPIVTTSSFASQNNTFTNAPPLLGSDSFYSSQIPSANPSVSPSIGNQSNVASFPTYNYFQSVQVTAAGFQPSDPFFQPVFTSPPAASQPVLSSPFASPPDIGTVPLVPTATDPGAFAPPVSSQPATPLTFDSRPPVGTVPCVVSPSPVLASVTPTPPPAGSVPFFQVPSSGLDKFGFSTSHKSSGSPSPTSILNQQPVSTSYAGLQSTPNLPSAVAFNQPPPVPHLQAEPQSSVPLFQNVPSGDRLGNASVPPLFPSANLGENRNLISGPPTTPPAPPTKGGLSNTYRLGNLKRPAYAPPPDLNVSANINMATVPEPAAPPTQTPTSLFTPVSPDSVDNSDTSLTCPRGSETMSTKGLFDGSNSATTDLSTNPTLLTYQSPVNNQAAPPTVLPPSEQPSLQQGQMYRPPYHHWFFKKHIEGKAIWQPFSMADSLNLEEAFTSPDISPDTKVPTDGGRYDVDVLRRHRLSVFWKEEPGEVRRCSWFVKGSLDSRYTPYEEKIATMLEEEYKIASTTNEWNRQVPLPDGEIIILHSAHAIAHHLRSSSPDAWGNSPQMQQKPRVVKRGLEDFDIPEGEPETVDHLLFLVHGIGKFCDLKFRPVTEVVDDFRSISLQLLQSHFRDACDLGTVNRVEVLPVSWHAALHTEDIDRKLRNITLGSIHRLRQFTNDTLLDILFYTSPVFCETIVKAVGSELNRLYDLFRMRNPQFNGGVSLGGHSLGSLILFDMLCNQKPDKPNNTEAGTSSTEDALSQEGDTEEERDVISKEEINGKTKDVRKTFTERNRALSYVAIGTAGTGKPYISYPQLVFHPKAFFALGSPIGMFVTVRGIDTLGEDFRFPTCPAFYNIFHPFDPVAYRVETLISQDLIDIQPVLIPHHKGRKRMHLELKDTMAHVGAAIKQRLMESIQSTLNTVYQLAMFHKAEDIGQEVDKVLDDQIIRTQATGNEANSHLTDQDGIHDANLELRVGSLNGGRRIDYVLQEAPLESFNEYIFALSSHVCYWESEDTMLMMLKEIYGSMGITPDNQVHQQILPFDGGDKVDGSSSSDQTHYVPLTSSNQPIGMDPTAPPSDNITIGPPPMSGFRRN